MKLFYRLVNGFIKLLLKIACRIDVSELNNVPKKGPYILITNHINFLEAPFLYLFLRPRRTIAVGKIELWDKPFTKFLMNLWEVIPLKRDTIDIQGMKNCIKVLEEGDFLCLAPEGTRSGDGILNEGKPGVIMFAQKGNAPIVPLVHWGGENFISNLKKFKRTTITIKVGDAVNITLPKGVKSDAKVRQQIADEVMIQIARLMPEKYHGVYAGRIDEEPQFLTKA